MRDIVRILILLCIPGLATALSLGSTNWKLNKSELESAGFSIKCYLDQFSDDSTCQVYMQIPKKFKGRKFYGGNLSIRNDGELLLTTSLNIVDVAETEYSEKPFHGVTFDVRKSLMNSVSVDLYFGIFIKSQFGTGDHITEVVEVRNIEEWLN